MKVFCFTPPKGLNEPLSSPLVSQPKTVPQMFAAQN
jgi:hypothetical protein